MRGDNTVDKKRIGNMLRQMRGNASQAYTAEQIGITKSSLNMYERGERTPRDDVKILIASYFGKSVQDIFFGNDSTIGA